MGEVLLTIKQQWRQVVAVLITLLCFVFSGCASRSGDQPADQTVTNNNNSDPWEGFNRKVFAFNDGLDRFVVLPITETYATLTPDPYEAAFARMFANMREFKHIFNDVLQWKWKQAANDTGRLLVNTTLGMAGLFDVATEMGLQANEGEDFDQTLAAWGVPQGPYVVLPFFGPSSVRGAPGLYVDAYIHPVIGIDHVRTRNVMVGWGLVDLRLGLRDAEKMIDGDRYSFIRDAYLQRREYLIQDGNVEDTFGGDVIDDEFDF